jgi:hypothetical protein
MVSPAEASDDAVIEPAVAATAMAVAKRLVKLINFAPCDEFDPWRNVLCALVLVNLGNGPEWTCILGGGNAKGVYV